MWWPSGCSGLGRWLLSPAGPRLVRVRVWGVVWPLIGIVLTVNREMHGPPLLAGFGLGALLLWWGPAQHVRELPG